MGPQGPKERGINKVSLTLAPQYCLEKVAGLQTGMGNKVSLRRWDGDEGPEKARQLQSAGQSARQRRASQRAAQ